MPVGQRYRARPVRFATVPIGPHRTLRMIASIRSGSAAGGTTGLGEGRLLVGSTRIRAGRRSRLPTAPAGHGPRRGAALWRGRGQIAGGARPAADRASGPEGHFQPGRSPAAGRGPAVVLAAAARDRKGRRNRGPRLDAFGPRPATGLPAATLLGGPIRPPCRRIPDPLGRTGSIRGRVRAWSWRSEIGRNYPLGLLALHRRDAETDRELPLEGQSSSATVPASAPEHELSGVWVGRRSLGWARSREASSVA